MTRQKEFFETDNITGQEDPDAYDIYYNFFTKNIIDNIVMIRRIDELGNDDDW